MQPQSAAALLLLFHLLGSSSSDEGFCATDICSRPDNGPATLKRFFYYDVNRGEGFNLLRDVYMRLAVFALKQDYWTLVLPPWNHLQHWRSNVEQQSLPWSSFFDVDSMKRFAPVVELHEVESAQSGVELGQTYRLQHFDEAFSRKDWDWTDRFEIVPCNQSRYREVDGEYHVSMWGVTVRTDSLSCVSFQGGASLLGQLVAHTSYSQQSWNIAKVTPTPTIFTGIERNERGGPFVCGHLRRGDFLYGRRQSVPSLAEAANTLIQALTRFNLTTVFLATDSTPLEKSEMVELLAPYDVVLYEPSADRLSALKDGGVAIVDQIICSAARYFVGTHESTFSFRIQEEREILGFPVEHTFNRFCGSLTPCEAPTIWKIVF